MIYNLEDLKNAYNAGQTFKYLFFWGNTPAADGGIRWNDPEIGVDWGIREPILSAKDSNSPFLKDAVTGFEEW